MKKKKIIGLYLLSLLIIVLTAVHMTHIISWTDTSNCHVFQEKLLVFWRGYQVYHEHMGYGQHRGNDGQSAIVRLKKTIELLRVWV